MTKGRILLKLILDEILPGDLELDTFPRRLNLQKRIYLLQVAGLDLRYRYNWYLRGPYCPSLTQDAFFLRDEIGSDEIDYEDYELTDVAKKKIEKAKVIWESPSGVSVESGMWVELLASLHYLKHIAYWPKGKVTKETIFKKLVEAKPQFKDKFELIEKAWERLSGAESVASKTLG
ncbi:MAG: hypothetical protein ACYS3N_17755 [Planctomycetota bacterium]|jgi:uncharacterized protein YwgA